jgi:hypothetical protein
MNLRKLLIQVKIFEEKFSLIPNKEQQNSPLLVKEICSIFPSSPKRSQFIANFLGLKALSRKVFKRIEVYILFKEIIYEMRKV